MPCSGKKQKEIISELVFTAARQISDPLQEYAELEA